MDEDNFSGIPEAEWDNSETEKSEQEWMDWWEGMSPSERGQLASVLEKSPRVGPSPGPQTDAYNSVADVLGYGGSAGGGKSALINLLAVNEHTRVVIFRQDATQLGGLIDDLVSFYGTSTGLNRQASVFRMSDRPGHTIEWGGIGDPSSENRWKGRSHDLLCADEVTEMSEKKIKFLLTWLRASESLHVPANRCRAVFTFNPPGSADDTTGGSGRWVIDYFAPWLDERFEDQAKPGEIRYHYYDAEGKERWTRDGSIIETVLRGQTFRTKPQSRTFIPARVMDNPYFYDPKKLNNPYLDNLMSLEEPYRSQMLLGEFRAGIVDSEFQVIPTTWIDNAMDRWTETGRSTDMSSVGIDVARGGTAFTVLARRHGFWWDQLVKIPGTETPDGPSVAGHAISHSRNDAVICIDALTVGTSPYDFLKQKGVKVIGIISNSTQMPQGFEGIEEKQNFLNVRSVLWWLLRKILDPENNLLPAIPNDNKLRSELISPRFDYKAGRFRVESKILIKERLGYSPDDADAMVYSLMNVFSENGSERLKSNPIKLDWGKLRGKKRAGHHRSGVGSWMGR